MNPIGGSLPRGFGFNLTIEEFSFQTNPFALTLYYHVVTPARSDETVWRFPTHDALQGFLENHIIPSNVPGYGVFRMPTSVLPLGGVDDAIWHPFPSLLFLSEHRTNLPERPGS